MSDNNNETKEYKTHERFLKNLPIGLLETHNLVTSLEMGLIQVLRKHPVVVNQNSK